MNQHNLKKSHLSIVMFAIFKIRKMTATWFLLGVSILSFGALIFFIFFKSDDKNAVVSNFQYYPLIFINIMLVLFILLVVIKIFGREFTDGTYLLLIARPFSRITIFILKLLTIWFLGLIFILINLGSSLIALYIAQSIKKNLEFLKIIQQLIFELVLYSLFIVFLASSGFIFISTFLDTQTVILIGFIFCSLFLLGGMPYSLINSLVDDIQITFKNGDKDSPYKVSKIKETILFTKNIEQKKVKYYNLTKAIFDFYQDFDYDNLRKISNNLSLGMLEAEIQTSIFNFFDDKLALLNNEEKTVTLTAKKVDKWNGIYNREDIKNLEIGQEKTLTFSLLIDRSFKSIDNLNPNNVYHQELNELIKDYYKELKAETAFSYGMPYAKKLISFKNESTYFTLNKNPHQELFDPVMLFQNLDDEYKKTSRDSMAHDAAYKFTEVEDRNEFYDEFKKIFNNQAALIFKNLENNIIRKVFDFKTITTGNLETNRNYKDYTSFIKVYNLISKINIIEHINQIWTANISYNDYSFDFLSRSFMDFNNQKNYLMSYKDFSFYSNASKLVVGDNFINTSLMMYIYLGVSVCFLGLTMIFLVRKNIV